MACATCGNSILFGGKKAGSRRYCSKNCYEADEVGRVGESIPDQAVEKFANEIRTSECPECNLERGLEIYKSYFIYSVLIYTSWQEKPLLSCKSCARKAQAKDLLASLLLGWWGVPFGIIVTPIILLMNLVALTRDPGNRPPSKALKERAREILAYDKLDQEFPQ